MRTLKVALGGFCLGVAVACIASLNPGPMIFGALVFGGIGALLTIDGANL